MAGEAIGWGAQFFLHNGTTLVELAGVFNMVPPNNQTDDVDVTNYASPGRKREYIAGLVETGEGTIEMNYVPGSVTDVLCRAAKDAGNIRAYKMVIPDAAGDPAWEIEGECYAKGYERNIPVDDKMTANLTVKFTGDPTEAAAA